MEVTVNSTFSTPGGGNYYDADATATDRAGIIAILDGYVASWAGTVPAGKTASDHRVIQLTQPIPSGGLSLSNYDMPQRVIIRGSGPYGYNPLYPFNPTCGTHITGLCRLGNCNNLEFALLTCENHQIENSSNGGFTKASSHTRWSTVVSTPDTVNPYCKTSDNIVYDRFHAAGFKAYCLGVLGGSTNLSIIDSYFEQSANDFLKLSGGTLVNIAIERNVFGRFNHTGVGAHTDMLQAQFIVSMDGYRFIGNIAFAGGWINNSGGQFNFLSDGSNIINMLSEQNISATRSKNAHPTAPAGRINNVVRHNTAILGVEYFPGALQDKNFTAPTMGGHNEKYENITTKPNTGSADTAGTDGVTIRVGDGSNATNVPMYAITDDYLLYWDGIIADNQDIMVMKPKDGARTHWDYAGGLPRIGGYNRSRDVFRDKKIQSHLGWPVAGPFIREYDPANKLLTSWTGVHSDVDGTNV